ARGAQRLRVGFGARLGATAQLRIERGALARRLGGAPFGVRAALGLDLPRVLGGDACLQLSCGGGFCGGEFLGCGVAALLGRETLGELALGVCFGLLALARGLPGLLFSRGARLRAEAQPLVSRAARPCPATPA